MTTYNNGPGNIPRLPERVVDTLINSAGVSRLAYDNQDQTRAVERLVHDTCEELLARLPTTPAAPAVTVSPAPRVEDEFRGNDERLCNCIDALLAMDATGSLVPYGVGEHARKMLAAAASRLRAAHLARQAQPTDRDAVLEEAAKAAEETKVVQCGYWYEPEDDGYQTRSDIAAAIRALKGKSGSGSPAAERETVRIIDTGDRRQLRRDGESGWELVDEENKRVRYLNSFEANFVNSVIKAAGKSGSEGAAS